MRVSAVINAKKLSLRNFHLALPPVVTAFIPIALGLIFGSIIFNFSGSDILSSFKKYFLSFATDFSNKSTPEIFSGMLLTYLPYFIMMFILGACVMGNAPTLILSFIKSAGIGMTGAYIYSVYALKGVEYCLLIFYPGKILSIFGMLMLTHSSFSMSTNINKLIKSGGEVKIDMNKYIVRSCFIGLIFILGSLVDFITIKCFSSLFSFS